MIDTTRGRRIEAGMAAFSAVAAVAPFAIGAWIGGTVWAAGAVLWWLTWRRRRLEPVVAAAHRAFYLGPVRWWTRVKIAALATGAFALWLSLLGFASVQMRSPTYSCRNTATGEVYWEEVGEFEWPQLWTWR